MPVRELKSTQGPHTMPSSQSAFCRMPAPTEAKNCGTHAPGPNMPLSQCGKQALGSATLFLGPHSSPCLQVSCVSCMACEPAANAGTHHPRPSAQSPKASGGDSVG